MHDLGTILYVNNYAADVEELRTRHGRLGVADRIWPSDAPAVPRLLNRLKVESLETYREKAYHRRLALLKSALRRRWAAEEAAECAAS